MESMNETENTSKNPKAIASITVDRLFGNRTYVIPDVGSDPSRNANLLILYGDNGSGKTTILRMVYSLLSPARKGGFKTFLAKTPFASFSVAFVDGTRLAAVRTAGQLVGGFELSLTYPDGRTIDILLHADADHTIKRLSDEDERSYQEFQDRVRDLGIALYYLSDDRRLQTIHLPEAAGHSEEQLTFHNVARSVRVVREHVNDHIVSERMVVDESEPRGLSLEPTIDAFETWTRKHALRASTRGEGNANTIYTDVIRRITSAYQPRVLRSDASLIDGLRNRLSNIADRSRSFSDLGLMSPPPVAELTGALNAVDENSQHIVGSVLEPYIQGLEARLNALQELRDVLSTFIQNLNDLYAGKRVKYSLRHGLAIVSDDGNQLRFEYLSSGEKQLLVLLCNTVIARDKTSIFVIDEPELSLNVKWQRKLVRTLLQGVAGSSVQFILATHSIELLAAYDDNVVKLQSREWPSLNVAASAS